MNTNDNNKRTFKQRAAEVLERKGFYIVIFGCLAIIAVTAILTFNSTKKEVPQALSDPAEQARQSFDEPLDSVQVTPIPEAKTPIVSPTPTIAPTPIPKKVSPTLYPAPLEGAVIVPFTKDELIYSKTLDQWAIHDGLDISAPKGAAVKCIASGVVELVENDMLMGYLISINHGNNMTSLYASLEELPSYKVGDSVKGGEVIGTVGTSALAECKDGPHLHFELRENGKAVDPRNRLTGLTKLPASE